MSSSELIRIIVNELGRIKKEPSYLVQDNFNQIYTLAKKGNRGKIQELLNAELAVCLAI